MTESLSSLRSIARVILGLNPARPSSPIIGRAGWDRGEFIRRLCGGSPREGTAREVSPVKQKRLAGILKMTDSLSSLRSIARVILGLRAVPFESNDQDLQISEVSKAHE